MRLVRQYNEIDCGICVAAMVAGTSWSAAVAADENPESNLGLSVAEFVALCARLGRPVIASKSQYRCSLSDVRLPNVVVALLVRRRRRRVGHYVAFDGKDILDPANGRQSAKKYFAQDLVLIRMFLSE